MKRLLKVYIPMTLLLFEIWIILTIPSDELLTSVSIQGNLVIGFLASMLVAVISMHFITYRSIYMMFNPINWVHMIAYICIIIYTEIISHLNVAKMIITGKIHPAIVKVKTSFKSEFGKSMFSNSITLTPGTITVKCDDNLFVHCLNFDKNDNVKVGLLFEKYGKRFLR
ncbi:MAG: Na+/H+ antiporter subunit E [DPANN group archaeon]|nr:Na+/H+ antiporter subunit E [DPANN group archaeon]